MLLRRVFATAAALLALGAVVAMALLPVSVPDALAQGSGTADPLERSQTAGGTVSDPASFTVGVSPAVQAPGRVTTAGLVVLRGPDWDKADNIRTIDTDPGGHLKWDRASGRIQVCDTNPDGHLVRGRVTVDGHAVKLHILATKKDADYVRAASNGRCREGAIPDYKVPKGGKPVYQFKVCLARSDKDPDGYCNTSDSNEWPKGDKKNNSCWDDGMSDQERIDCVGGVYEYCHQWQHTSGMFPKWCTDEHTPKDPKPSLKPPVGRKPDINARPDLSLPRGQPGDIGPVTQPVAILLRWLVWTVLGACVLGFVIVGGRMAINHQRGEAGANFTELGWVMIAVVVAGSGLAIAFVSLLVNPF